jgi:hypothetical protein
MRGSQLADVTKLNAGEVCGYLDRVLSAERFCKAPSLSHLLQYLITKTAQGHFDDIKESIIAIDVFGRAQSFDGRLDNIVRVQAHRLRKLLEAYYSAEGAGDPFQISIPKGSYVPRVERRDGVQSGDWIEPDPPLIKSAEAPHAVNRASNPRAALKLYAAFAATFLGGAVALLLILMASGRVSPTARRAGADRLREQPLAALWGGLLQPGVNCVISFTNPAFLWSQTPRTRQYLYYQGPLSAPVGTQVDISAADPYIDPDIVRGRGPYFFSDSWTGTGEVFAVHKLTRLFAEAGQPLSVVRSRALTYSDMRGANVIFLGSPWANELQDKFHAGETPLICVGTERIINRKPRPGELASFSPVLDAKTRQLVASYALFSVLPGVTPGTKIFSSAGINTYGTSAAIDYLTSPSAVTELLKRLDPVNHRRLPGVLSGRDPRRHCPGRARQREPCAGARGRPRRPFPGACALS